MAVSAARVGFRPVLSLRDSRDLGLNGHLVSHGSLLPFRLLFQALGAALLVSLSRRSRSNPAVKVASNRSASSAHTSPVVHEEFPIAFPCTLASERAARERKEGPRARHHGPALGPRDKKVGVDPLLNACHDCRFANVREESCDPLEDQEHVPERWRTRTVPWRCPKKRTS